MSQYTTLYLTADDTIPNPGDEVFTPDGGIGLVLSVASITQEQAASVGHPNAFHEVLVVVA